MDLSSLFDFITAHPGAVFTVLCMISGQFMKTIVFTPARAAAKGRFRWFWLGGRKTLAWHPALAGFVLGWLWEGGLEEDRYQGGTWSAAIYFAMFGGLSVWAFEAAKGLAKKYVGIDLENLGRTTPVPAAVVGTPEGGKVAVIALPAKDPTPSLAEKLEPESDPSDPSSGKP